MQKDNFEKGKAEDAIFTIPPPPPRSQKGTNICNCSLSSELLDTGLFSSQEHASEFYNVGALSFPLSWWESSLNNNLRLPLDLKIPTETNKPKTIAHSRCNNTFQCPIQYKSLILVYLGKLTTSNLNRQPHDPVSWGRVPVYQHEADIWSYRHTWPICIPSRTLRTLNKTLLHKGKLPHLLYKVNYYD